MASGVSDAATDAGSIAGTDACLELRDVARDTDAGSVNIVEVDEDSVLGTDTDTDADTDADTDTDANTDIEAGSIDGTVDVDSESDGDENR